MSGRKWCEKCGELEASPFAWPIDGRRYVHRAGCPGGRVIPIATICDPPEPTVIDESDLAPGMVVVAVDDVTSSTPQSWVCSPDAHLSLVGWVTVAAIRMSFLTGNSFDAQVVRYVAGDP